MSFPILGYWYLNRAKISWAIGGVAPAAPSKYAHAPCSSTVQPAIYMIFIGNFNYFNTVLTFYVTQFYDFYRAMH